MCIVTKGVIALYQATIIWVSVISVSAMANVVQSLPCHYQSRETLLTPTSMGAGSGGESLISIFK